MEHVLEEERESGGRVLDLSHLDDELADNDHSVQLTGYIIQVVLIES
jgi:hypothetical protein